MAFTLSKLKGVACEATCQLQHKLNVYWVPSFVWVPINRKWCCAGYMGAYIHGYLFCMGTYFMVCPIQGIHFKHQYIVADPEFIEGGSTAGACKMHVQNFDNAHKEY